MRNHGWIARAFGLEQARRPLPSTPPSQPASGLPPVDAALEHMTPRSREVLHPSWLEHRVEGVSLAEANNLQLRFRIGSDPDAQGHFPLIPDTERARLLLDSPAAPRLQDAIDGALRALTHHPGARIKGIALPHDRAGAVLADALALTDADRDARNARGSRQARMVADSHAEIRRMDGVNGGYNYHDWIITMPDHSRALLASVGAYRPQRGEDSAADPAGWTSFLPGFLRHEAEHSITRSHASDPRVDWLEEGIADALALARPASAGADDGFGWARRSYGRGDDASRRATDGWRPYPKPSEATNERASASDHEYVSREDGVLRLLAHAGIDRDTSAGYRAARHLLQDQPAERVPARLAGAIAERHGLDAAARRELANLILDADGDANVMRRIDDLVARRRATSA